MQRLELDKHEQFDLIINNENKDIMAWCGLFNGGRYPNGVFRIMNRLYINNDYRSKYFNPFTRILYWAQRYRSRDKIKLLFLSREGEKGKRLVQNWVKRGASENGWKVSDDLIKVANGADKSSYQFIAYKFFDNKLIWNPPFISLSEWKELKE